LTVGSSVGLGAGLPARTYENLSSMGVIITVLTDLFKQSDELKSINWYHRHRVRRLVAKNQLADLPAAYLVPDQDEEFTFENPARYTTDAIITIHIVDRYEEQDNLDSPLWRWRDVIRKIVVRNVQLTDDFRTNLPDL